MRRGEKQAGGLIKTKICLLRYLSVLGIFTPDRRWACLMLITHKYFN